MEINVKPGNVAGASKERAAETAAFGHPDSWPQLTVKDILSSRRPSFVNGAGWTCCLMRTEASYHHSFHSFHRGPGLLIHFTE